MQEPTRADYRNPDYRRGYNAGHRDGLERAVELAAEEAEAQSAATRGRSFDVTVGEIGDLEAGDVIERDLVTPGTGTRTITPCCARPVDLTEEETLTVCCRCNVAYRAVLFQEEPDGWGDGPWMVARFTVEAVGIRIAVHRGGTKTT